MAYECRRSEQSAIRWHLELQEYDYTIGYLKGTENSVADTVSRIPEHPSHSSYSFDAQNSTNCRKKYE